MGADGKKSLMLRRFVLYTVIFFFLLSIGAVYLSAKSSEKSDDTLSLHGWVEGTRVTLSSKIPGQITSLPIEEGDLVKAGQRIVEIKSDQIRAQVANADAEIARSREQHQKATEEVSVVESAIEGARIDLRLAETRSSAEIARAQARLAEAEAKFAKAGKDYERFRQLAAKQVISQNKFDGVEEDYQSKKAALEAASRDLELAKTTRTEISLKQNAVSTLQRQLASAKTTAAAAAATMEAAAAKKAEAQATLDDATLSSPLTGTVIDKVAEPGEQVMPGSPLAVLVDLNQLYVKTYVEQTDVGKIRLGDTAKIKVDSFPDRTFDGTIYFIASKAEFTPRNIQMDEFRSRMVYMVKVSVQNPEGLVKPGLPADVNISLNAARPAGAKTADPVKPAPPSEAKAANAK